MGPVKRTQTTTKINKRQLNTSTTSSLQITGKHIINLTVQYFKQNSVHTHIKRHLLNYNAMSRLLICLKQSFAIRDHYVQRNSPNVTEIQNIIEVTPTTSFKYK